ncbi:PREDICTED: protein Mdm4 isoform X3 [Hipposideros armiger]|uniref:Protein Mdm4 isoform X3 n=1 Tax=Hipposideros armiger TaxID=186990 RepID=A0A8B7S162_HIPAR|nr:PREDICTED: protein Mdm4 isoform X3 [Hipposideros armiger]
MLPLFDDCCEFQSCSFLCVTHCVAHELVSQNGTATSPGLNHFCCTNRYLSLLFRKVQKNAVIPGKVPKKAIFPYHLPHSINAQILEKDVGTAIVSDMTDDVWILNEPVSEQFGVGIKVEATDTEQTSEEVGKVRDKTVIEAGKNDDLEDSESMCDDTDVEVASEDEWQCTECKKFNSPSKRYCFRCWALRKDWYSDCSKLTHSLSTSDITAIPEEKESEGIDIPDCRRTISAPVVRPKDVYRKEENPKLFDPCSSVEFLDLAHSSESQETLSSLGEQSADLLKQRTVIENMEDCRNLLKPCSLCEKRPRDGNIIHGRTSHLVTCFHCARRLKKAGASCPICKKEIQLVIRVFIA